MNSGFFRTAFRNTLAEIVVIVFAGMLVWWISLHFIVRDASSNALQLFGASYQVLAWYGAVVGFVMAQRWGGMKSFVGRAVTAFALGLLFQTFGQITYSSDVYFLHISIPYPSVGDIGFFGSIPCYFYGALMLARASGAHLSLRTLGNQALAVLIPIVLLGTSYYFFLTGYQFDFTQPLKIFLDFGYPLGQALYVSMAILAFLLSRKTLGGFMRLPILFFIVALVVQYFCDFTFLYQAAQGTYYSGNIDDLMYCISYALMAIALCYIGRVHEVIKNG